MQAPFLADLFGFVIVAATAQFVCQFIGQVHMEYLR